MKKLTVLAIDLGAESGRVMGVHFDGERLALEEVNRFRNPVTKVGGRLQWDFLHLWREINAGISHAKTQFPHIASLGVDTWGVDFGLLDKQGQLIGNPVNYRDPRTEGMMEKVFAIVPKADVFAQTGIQFMALNTLYQMMSLVESGSPQLEIANTFLTAPDLLNYWLTGAKVCEFSNATTTQLFNPSTGNWATDMMDKLGIPSHIFPEIVLPGTKLGEFEGIPVVAPACHDTGSAVAAMPAFSTNAAYISSGTWSLVGLEVAQPILSPEALLANVTNEGGVYGTYRLLKNVMGLWVLQQCRQTWADAGESFSYEALVAMAEQAPKRKTLIDVNNDRFLTAGDHPQRIRDYCQETGQAAPQNKGEMVRVVLRSLAVAYVDVLHKLQAVSGQAVEVIHIMGGGSKNELLNQMTADNAGIPVVAGPVEATVLGNALVQLITLGEIRDIEEGRGLIAGMAGMRRYEPN